MQLKVFKFEGAGNDFVALDGRRTRLPECGQLTRLVQALCDRRRGVGGDGILLLKDPETPGADFRMVYYNSDGSDGEMCGNGARCIARFAVLMGAATAEMSFQTDAGPHRATATADGVTIYFPPVPEIPRRVPLQALGRDWDADFLRVGVPHLVVWVEDLEHLDIATAGRALRFHEALAPSGANVNFSRPDESASDRVFVRTYERGVEAETLACGTGSTAVAICRAARLGQGGAQTLRVVPTSGEELRIGFDLREGGVEGVTLAGPARLVFTTVVSWDEVSGKLVPFDFDAGRR